MAVKSLRLQGYVCPGILVTSTDDASVSVLREHWGRRALAAPPGYRLWRLGLSAGCSLTPFVQGPSPSLSDAICAVLATLKRTERTANMDNILAGLQTDFGDIPAPADFLQLVHRTLGALIKGRRVYYTGKGYFLVVPEKGEQRASWGEQFHRFLPSPAAGREVHEAAVQTEEQEVRASPAPRTPGTPGSAHRQAASPHLGPSTSPQLGPTSPSSLGLDTRGDSREGSPKSPMERSQSFRINKKAQKLATKGGSLRLSKKDAAVFKDEAETKKNDEDEERESPTPKKMERKNSVLGRLFGRKKSSSSPKKEILTFNGQFPPPDLLEHMREMARAQAGHGAETQTPPQRKRSQPSPPTTSSMHQIKNGPNGNFVMYDKSGLAPVGSPQVGLRSPLSPAARRPLPQSPPPAYYQPEVKTAEPIYNIYSQPSYPPKPVPPAYSSAPPYRPKEPLPAPPRTALPPPAKAPSPQKQVHFAPSPLHQPRVANSESGSSSLSGPSSLDSVLYDDSLASIEKSNQELEQRLGGRPAPRVDTIHNNRLLVQEVIYEESTSDLSRSSSVSTLKPDWGTADHPSLADLGSIADLSSKFQSLTARKLMAGLSISSIDTLLEVNSDERNNGKLSILNESTETIDFGVI